MPEQSPSADTSRQIPTNLRLLLIIEVVAKAGVPVTPATLGETLDLPKPTVHRLLATAEAEEFLQRDVDGRSYGPGKRLRGLAMNVLSSHRVRAERLRVLKALAQKVGETCNIATAGRDGMTYLDRIETHWPLRIQLPIGTQVPFHCTASGKMYLASLRPDKLDRLLKIYPLEAKTPGTITDAAALKAEISETRRRGYSTDNEEFMEGMAAIAVPIADDQGRLMSTLSLHAPLQRLDIKGLSRHLETLRETADELGNLALD